MMNYMKNKTFNPASWTTITEIAPTFKFNCGWNAIIELQCTDSPSRFT